MKHALTIQSIFLLMWFHHLGTAANRDVHEGALGCSPQDNPNARVLSGLFPGLRVEWTAEYSGPGGEGESSLLALDSQDNVYVSGNSASSDFVVKYNPLGVQQWVSRDNDPTDYHQPSAIVVDNSGNVYVHGNTRSPYRFLTNKYNAAGVQQWSARYEGPSKLYDQGSAMTLDASGNVYVAGWSRGVVYPVVGSDLDFATVKYTPDGIRQWASRYDASQRTGTVWIIANDYGQYIAVDRQGNTYVTGTTGNNICTVKYDAQGVEQWVKIYSGPGVSNDKPVGIAVDGNDNVYVAGTTQGYGTDYDIVAIKYDASGNEKWVSRYNGPSDDSASDMVLDGMGNLYVVGSSNVSGRSLFATVRFNSAGVPAWCQTYDTSSAVYSFARAIAVDGSGGIYVTGYRFTKTADYQYISIKYDTLGQQQWIVQHEPGFSSLDIAVDRNGGVVVVGKKYVSGVGYRTVTVKYSQVTTAIKEGLIDVPAAFELMHNYPNPFNPSTRIQFNIPQTSFVTLKIYSALGVEVATLVSSELSGGRYEAVWNAGSASSGIYFYRMQAGSYTQTKKMILLR